MKKTTITVPFIIGSLILGGCAQTDQNTNDTNPASTQQKPNGMMEPQTAPALTAEQNDQMKMGKADHEPTTLTYNVNGGNFYFTPTVINARKGDTIKIIFKNDGGMHNWVLDEFKVTMDPIKTGETSTVQFIADKAGTFEFYCSVGKHRQMGMKGMLIVE